MTQLTSKDLADILSSIKDENKRRTVESVLLFSAFQLVNKSETGLDGILATIDPRISSFDADVICTAINRYSGINAIMIQTYKGQWVFTAAGWKKK